MSKTVYSNGVLTRYRGKWVIVQATTPMFAQPMITGRILEVRPDGLELACAGHRVFVNGEYVVAMMVPANQDDFDVHPLEEALKRVNG